MLWWKVIQKRKKRKSVKNVKNSIALKDNSPLHSKQIGFLTT